MFGGGFGNQNPPSQPAGTGLFGFSNPTTTTQTSAPALSSLFGTTAPSAGQQPSTFSFGQPAAAPSTTAGFGLFGSQLPAVSASAPSAFTFNSAPTVTTTAALPSFSTFGSQSGGSLFGAGAAPTTTSQPFSFGIGQTTVPTSAPSLFGNFGGAAQNAPAVAASTSAFTFGAAPAATTAAAASQPGTFGFSFGQSTPAGTGFAAALPPAAAPTTGSLFGGLQPTQPGVAAAPTGTLFQPAATRAQATPAGTGFSFGQTPAAPAVTPTVGLGAAPTSTSTFNFGFAPATTATSSMFGNLMSGTTQPAPATTSVLQPASTAAATAPSFGAFSFGQSSVPAPAIGNTTGFLSAPIASVSAAAPVTTAQSMFGNLTAPQSAAAPAASIFPALGATSLGSAAPTLGTTGFSFSSPAVPPTVTPKFTGFASAAPTTTVPTVVTSVAPVFTASSVPQSTTTAAPTSSIFTAMGTTPVVSAPQATQPATQGFSGFSFGAATVSAPATTNIPSFAATPQTTAVSSAVPAQPAFTASSAPQSNAAPTTLVFTTIGTTPIVTATTQGASAVPTSTTPATATSGQVLSSTIQPTSSDISEEDKKFLDRLSKMTYDEFDSYLEDTKRLVDQLEENWIQSTLKLNGFLSMRKDNTKAMWLLREKVQTLWDFETRVERTLAAVSLSMAQIDETLTYLEKHATDPDDFFKKNAKRISAEDRYRANCYKTLDLLYREVRIALSDIDISRKRLMKSLIKEDEVRDLLGSEKMLTGQLAPQLLMENPYVLGTIASMMMKDIKEVKHGQRQALTKLRFQNKSEAGTQSR
ncbi:nuclear pore glycoprotein p62-like [Paramacrobiotus metropolitanus]|uniref:nuclear pore glycoprotein p62-like n=1 Tax=Paramacrobiotus metropolitanus TaxID=2943436 RepID=UPI00244650E0|nr:nuclear pore glycoprotein p62-like [Paramacrobiotus metropolitanus]